MANLRQRSIARIGTNRGLPEVAAMRPGPDPRLLRESLNRCTSTPGFFDRMYERFFAVPGRHRAGPTSHDDMQRERSLNVFLSAMMHAHEGERSARVVLDRIAARHRRLPLYTRLRAYELWSDSLVRAVKECDPHFESEVEGAWRDTLEWVSMYLVLHA